MYSSHERNNTRIWEIQKCAKKKISHQRTTDTKFVHFYTFSWCVCVCVWFLAKVICTADSFRTFFLVNLSNISIFSYSLRPWF